MGNINRNTRLGVNPTTDNAVVNATRYAAISTVIEVVPG